MLKIEEIKQNIGFAGSHNPPAGACDFSNGFTQTLNGMASMKYTYKFVNGYDLTESTNTICGMAYGPGRTLFVSGQNGTGSFLYWSDGNNKVYQSYGAIFSSTNAELVHNLNGAWYDLHVDPKGRLMWFDARYVGLFDATNTNEVTGNVNMSNGSANVVGVGTEFVDSHVGRSFRSQGDTSVYTVSAVTTSTALSLTSVYTGSNGNDVDYYIASQWRNNVFDFGGNVVYPGSAAYQIPCCNYEDTVIVGRGSKLCSINTLTDTITTDAAPIFTVPSTYRIDHIVANSNGILLGLNTGDFARDGALVLWDNASARSIAPWIWTKGVIYSICKYNSNWIVITGDSIWVTNGYSMELIYKFDYQLTANTLTQVGYNNSVVVGDELYFEYTGSVSGVNKIPYGMVKFNLITKTMEFIPRDILYTGGSGVKYIMHIPYINTFVLADNNTYGISSSPVIERQSFKKMALSTPTKNCEYITSPVGQGENEKIALGVKINLRPFYKFGLVGVDKDFSFQIRCEIYPCDINEYSYLSSTLYQEGYKDRVVFDNSAGSYFTSVVGNEIYLVQGQNSTSYANHGYVRTITSATETTSSIWTYMLDEDLPAEPYTNDFYAIRPYRLIGKKTITTSGGRIPQIYFPIKDQIKGTKFKIKVYIEDNTELEPIELSNLQFIYDDLGVL